MVSARWSGCSGKATGVSRGGAQPLFKARLRSLEFEIAGEVVVRLVKVLGQSLLTHRIS